MFRRLRVKPSKPQSLMGMIVGVVFVIIGIIFAIPNVGAFGLFWTFIALVITISHAYNFFSEKGISSYEIDTETENINNSEINFDEKLRKLESLRMDGLITQDEYDRKRNEIMNEKW